ncbi:MULTISPECIES: peptide chain release factor aRF-1 [Acidiplasma]|jgi:peptide chain release factor subunit 1|uniref:Peptide chain release factor subunit 1 n=2 Tax=Acidiplasma TaxID=507753 RepID=A0A0Q0RJV4_9ARCH|nr:MULTISPECIES: peptide chain release factor aRF-1 [Acidiplasma]KJE49010.1 peptide chain release factor 1 [Acidiplasma sp. MBA-1]KPV46548.1 peptide chain release factor 1 [Acidiplasma aeolicum]KQB34637.1 peptide chain release factor 1 [Acidiplasma aeolicum]KQB35703.1 peptide chain release factor 1 [Acidiplasma cupricumulans]WMT54445.1 MAG: peptide chain release factor aRF-1 [Acidiplasma sp.]
MESEDYKRYEFKKAMEELSRLHGRGTELISLYIPPDKQISDVVQYLREEYSTSANIKSKTTRKNVLAAIESIMSRLKYYKQPPETGLVFFVGHVATRGDQTEMYTKIIEPPEPIQTFLYKCDSSFHLEQLTDQLREKELYGLLVIDRKEATIGFLKGTKIEVVDYEYSLVPSKHRQGGQSSRRFERLIEIAANEFYKKIGDIANATFMPVIKDIITIFVGGPGATKEYFVEKSYLRNEIKEKIKYMFDIGYTDESGLRELVEKASESIKDMRITREKDIINRFLREIKKPDGGLGVYGENAVVNALKMKNLELLIISDSIRKIKYFYKCPVCGAEKTFTEEPEEQPLCDNDGTPMNYEREDDFIEDLYKLADAAGTTVEFVSEDSDEGRLLKTAFGGVAGILRYVPEKQLNV